MKINWTEPETLHFFVVSFDVIVPNSSSVAMIADVAVDLKMLDVYFQACKSVKFIFVTQNMVCRQLKNSKISAGIQFTEECPGATWKLQLYIYEEDNPTA